MLRIGALDVSDGAFVVMAIVNRTPDSFYDRGATYELTAAVERVDRVVAEGAKLQLAPGDAGRIAFDLASNEHPSPLAEDSRDEPHPVALPHGLLLVLEDQETTEKTIRWLRFKVWKPRKYLTARAKYDPGGPRLTVTVEANGDRQLPAGGVRVQAFPSLLDAHGLPLADEFLQASRGPAGIGTGGRFRLFAGFLARLFVQFLRLVGKDVRPAHEIRHALRIEVHIGHRGE